MGGGLTAGRNGGGIDNTRENPGFPATLTLDRTTVTDNRATGQGGGIASGQRSEITLTNSRISGIRPDDTTGDTPAQDQNTRYSKGSQGMSVRQLRALRPRLHDQPGKCLKSLASDRPARYGRVSVLPAGAPEIWARPPRQFPR
ncbi:hypothetical protein [Streptomyces sp. NBC_00063]|uniref:hypothetical protein n=1 Tax=Streptomyces sp. NBC_00063 TaxID=2975638 RepID=UPI003D75C957